MIFLVRACENVTIPIIQVNVRYSKQAKGSSVGIQRKDADCLEKRGSRWVAKIALLGNVRMNGGCVRTQDDKDQIL